MSRPPMHATTFNTETRLYLTLPNIESPESCAYYIFVPIFGRFTDAEILSELIRFATNIQTPLDTLQLPGNAFRRGGLWLELLTPLGCNCSDVVLRLFAGLKEFQEMLAQEGGKLALVESPVYGVDDFSERFPNMIMPKGGG
ncbi:uncharacterized protein BDW47DRAFT_124250 [Aspergillus candidus]|uniref:Uncharacterized protein n=1 Tax=Aspergillus candidus TaxID=41067 RepID=A0A2I2FFZ4_ASPCN|nr:hypothetical protein BDW47DRAFT_124250 [Aspergillus candidus]PLB39558.1 hypothetical protein BDW47DRAFT_124250 [Aspergillus candidus]